MLQLYRLYIGLSHTNCSETIDRNQVVNTIARYIDSFTVYDAQGFFKGKPEDTLVITIAYESEHHIKTLAYDLCVQLHQDGIGLEYDGCYHRITHDHSTIQKQPSFGLDSSFYRESRNGAS